MTKTAALIATITLALGVWISGHRATIDDARADTATARDGAIDRNVDRAVDRAVDGASPTPLVAPTDEPSAIAMGSWCEGKYDCYASGKKFSFGDRTVIGFADVESCPLTTTLGDNSWWKLIPGSCSCK